jgi:hypothetical protein
MIILTETEKTRIQNLLNEHSLLDLIKLDTFKPFGKPRAKDFVSQKKCRECGHLHQSQGDVAYQAALKSHRLNTALNHELFKYACCWESGLEYGSKIYSKAFQMAWSRGKSAGLHEVYYELQDLAELLNVKG